ncbi:ATP-binding protein [Microbulbifer aggregans]|uniref:ATP-binding protein n=1 Tax=Microbulbifer aggregans TaxID=1769779 RepID=UPI001CFF1520|nr:ATP-binding protein [Microbulbifer aggregans]
MSPLDQIVMTNLRRLTVLRALALCGYAGSSLWFGHSLSGGALACVVLGVCTALVSGWRTRGQVAIRRLEFFAHLLMDWLWLPPLLALSGGAANPFITYLLVPLTIAAATMPRFYSWMMALVSIAIYTALILAFPGTEQDHQAHTGAAGGAFYRHLVGMWATFAFSSLLIAGFVNSMASTLRERDRRLHQLQQAQARRDQVLALGTLAAGTAHELASPLQTMALVVEELQARGNQDADAKADLALLRQQVDVCKQALAQLKRRASDPESRDEVQGVAGFLQRALERWQLLRPEVHYELSSSGPADMAARLPLTLEQALINLLNNAADASAGEQSVPILVEATWTTQRLRVCIIDSGPGLGAGSSSSGFGIGLILSEAALSQLGGRLHLSARASGRGTVATIELPLLAPAAKHARWEQPVGHSQADAGSTNQGEVL